MQPSPQSILERPKETPYPSAVNPNPRQPLIYFLFLYRFAFLDISYIMWNGFHKIYEPPWCSMGEDLPRSWPTFSLLPEKESSLFCPMAQRALRTGTQRNKWLHQGFWVRGQRGATRSRTLEGALLVERDPWGLPWRRETGWKCGERASNLQTRGPAEIFPLANQESRPEQELRLTQDRRMVRMIF